MQIYKKLPNQLIRELFIYLDICFFLSFSYYYLFYLPLASCHLLTIKEDIVH